MNHKDLSLRSRGIELSSLVLKNARIINVFNGLIEDADIAIEDGIIVGIGSYSGKTEIDLFHQYVSPGFIDGHVHIESSMLVPSEFAKIVMPKGTTSVIADPHEIANVCGLDGIRFMIESSKKVPLDCFMMIPSCVPSTPYETSGAKIDAKDLSAFLKEENILGLGEVMDYPGVILGKDDIYDKINIMKNHPIDGHSPGIYGKELNAYIMSGIQTDHEATSPLELMEKVSRGMYIHLREGSATRNVKALSVAVNPLNSHRLLFCTDDKHPEDIKKEGHINYNINLAIENGVDPICAIQMATINVATCYQLKGYGAIAPGYVADLVVFDNLLYIEPKMVYKKGTLVAKNNISLFESDTALNDSVLNTVHIKTEDISFQIPLKSDKVNVIGLIKNNVTTLKIIEKVKVVNGFYEQEDSSDLLKLAVIERHHFTGNIGLALVKGYGLKKGAIALTIAHDSHNLMILSDNDIDMKIAMDKIIEIGGGIVLVKEGKVMHSLTLEVGGIMTSKGSAHVEDLLYKMERDIRKMGVKDEIDDPFLSLAFLSLPVIPELKCTDFGLFDVNSFQIIPLEVEGGVL
ncbi:MAG: adenine deaminase [Firmicutes bacterium]|nr:adenine deaminase [Bacillota bacterium]